MAAWTAPPLTTVRQPIVEKGRLAARLLIQQMQGREVESPPPLETSLVVRGSTARPKETVVERAGHTKSNLAKSVEG